MGEGREGMPILSSKVPRKKKENSRNYFSMFAMQSSVRPRGRPLVRSSKFYVPRKGCSVWLPRSSTRVPLFHCSTLNWKCMHILGLSVYSAAIPGWLPARSMQLQFAFCVQIRLKTRVSLESNHPRSLWAQWGKAIASEAASSFSNAQSLNALMHF